MGQVLEEALAQYRASLSTDEQRAAFDADLARRRERARYESEVAHWDAWASCGTRHIDRPEPNCKPEVAVELLLQKARLVFGDQDWSAWEWRAHEYGVQLKRVIRFTWRDGVWTRSKA